jgi:hypothetical protein
MKTYVITWRMLKAKTLLQRLEARSIRIWAQILDL